MSGGPGSWRRGWTLLSVAVGLCVVALLYVVWMWHRGIETGETLAPSAGVTSDTPVAESPVDETAGIERGFVGARGTDESRNTSTKSRSDSADVALRLKSVRARTAREAVDAALSLPIGDPDQIEAIARAGTVCRRIEVSDEAADFASALRNGMVADTDADRSLHARWFAAMRGYCDGVVGSELLELASRLRSPPEARDAGGLIDDYAFASTLGEAAILGNTGMDTAISDSSAAERLWRIVLQSDSPTLVGLAVDHLALAGNGVFAEPSPSPNSLSLTGSSGNAHDQLATLRRAAGVLYTCRTFGSCGPGTRAALDEPWVSDLHATMGVEGHLRSTLSPSQWAVVESLYGQMVRMRANARRG